MRKQHNIRWRDGEQEEARRQITNFNQRLYRQRKANPNADWLPEIKNVIATVESIKTRKELNALMKEVKAFTAKSALKTTNLQAQFEKSIDRFNKVRKEQLEKNPDATWLPSERSYDELKKIYTTDRDIKRVTASLNRFTAKTAQPVQGERGKISQWSIEERNKVVPKINEKREKLKKEIEEKPFTIRGKDQGYPVRESTSVRNNALEPVTSDPMKMTAKEVDEQLLWMDRALNAGYDLEHRKLWQRNYIKGLMRVGMPEDVVQLLLRVDPNTFAEIIDTDAEGSISFIYDLQHLEERANYIRELWSKHDTGRNQTNINLDDIDKEIKYEESLGYVGRKYVDSEWYKPYHQVRKAKGFKK